MNAEESKNLAAIRRDILFPGRRDQTDFAEHTGQSKQYLHSKLKPKKLDLNFLQQYADWKGISLSEVIAMLEPKKPAKTAPGKAKKGSGSIVNEEGITAYSSPKADLLKTVLLENSELREELAKLQNTVAGRNRYIAEHI